MYRHRELEIARTCCENPCSGPGPSMKAPHSRTMRPMDGIQYPPRRDAKDPIRSAAARKFWNSDAGRAERWRRRDEARQRRLNRMLAGFHR